MTGSDRRTLIIGILIGLTVGASLFIFEGRRRLQPAAAAPSGAMDAGGNTAGMPADAQRSEEASYARLTDEEQKAIGVETVQVKRQTIRREIAAPGKVVEPETGIDTIKARSSGRIERLLINITGGTVNRGDPVAQIYSPEVSSGDEYRLALRNRQRLNGSKEIQAINDADELVRATRKRLEQSGLTAGQIEQIASSAEKAVPVTTYSQLSGVITKRNVTEGQYVNEGDALFDIVDLSTAWVEVNLFEYDIPVPRTGQTVKITSPSLAGNSIDGTVSLLQPSLILPPMTNSHWSSIEGAVSFGQAAVDPQNRALMARVQVPNPQMRLRPGMFVQVSFDSAASNVVAVPRSAVLDTGKGKVVYIAKGSGVFEKRSIEATIADENYYAATRGIDSGERVVTHGNFLIDSQTRLTTTITGMYTGSKAYGSGDIASAASSDSNYTVTLQTEPAPPKGGSSSMFHVNVMGPDKKPVTDAQVQLTLNMPAMPSMGMGQMQSVVKLTWNGSEYAGEGSIAMAGPWNVTVEAHRGRQLLGSYKTHFDAK
jgi:Cu(I)/Ag(I) efflux system membrane fusion protein